MIIHFSYFCENTVVNTAPKGTKACYTSADPQKDDKNTMSATAKQTKSRGVNKMATITR